MADSEVVIRGRFVDNVSKGVSKVRSTLLSLRGLLAGGIFATLAKREVGASISELSKFERKMREVNTLLKLTPSSFGEYTRAIRQLSLEFGTDPLGNAATAYDIVSAGTQDAADSLKILASANKLAIAGVSDTKSAFLALNSTMKPFGIEVEEVDRVADMLFNTVETGIVTLTSLSSNLGKVSANAKQTGATVEEMLAGIAVITASTGLSAEQSSTLYDAFFREIQQKSGVVRKLAEDFDLDLRFGQGALEEFDGVIGMVRQINEELQKIPIEDRADAMSKMFTGESARAFNTLTLNAERFDQVLTFIGENVNSNTAAFDEMEKSLGRTIERMQNAQKIGRQLFAQGVLGGLLDDEDLGTEASQKILEIYRGLALTTVTISAGLSDIFTILKTIGDVLGALIFYVIDSVTMIFNIITKEGDHVLDYILALGAMAFSKLLQGVQKLGAEIMKLGVSLARIILNEVVTPIINAMKEIPFIGKQVQKAFDDLTLYELNSALDVTDKKIDSIFSNLLISDSNILLIEDQFDGAKEGLSGVEVEFDKFFDNLVVSTDVLKEQFASLGDPDTWKLGKLDNILGRINELFDGLSGALGNISEKKSGAQIVAEQAIAEMQAEAEALEKIRVLASKTSMLEEAFPNGEIDVALVLDSLATEVEVRKGIDLYKQGVREIADMTMFSSSATEKERIDAIKRINEFELEMFEETYQEAIGYELILAEFRRRLNAEEESQIQGIKQETLDLELSAQREVMRVRNSLENTSKREKIQNIRAETALRIQEFEKQYEALENFEVLFKQFKLDLAKAEAEEIAEIQRGVGGGRALGIDLSNLELDEDSKITRQELQLLNSELQRFESSSTSAFASFIRGSASAKDAFAQVANAILDQIAALIAQLILAITLKAILTGVSGSDAASVVNVPFAGIGGEGAVGGAAGGGGASTAEVIAGGGAFFAPTVIPNAERERGQGGEKNVVYNINAVDAKSFSDMVNSNPAAFDKVMQYNMQNSPGVRRSLRGG